MKLANAPNVGELTLDHTGHFIADRAEAAAALEDLGFTVTPFSAQSHPDPETGVAQLTGTGNICVMLAQGYLEFLVHTADTAIGREFTAALEHRAGLHLSAFGVPDAAAQRRALVEAGVSMRPLVNFSREIETAQGQAKAAFTVARLAAGAMPEGRVQFLTHHNAAAMWQPRWTVHRNGARTLQALLISSPDPDETAARFGHLLKRQPYSHGAALRLELDQGMIDVLPEDVASALVGVAVDPGQSCFVGLRISVADPVMFLAHPGAREVSGGVALPFHPALGRGGWLFVQA